MNDRTQPEELEALRQQNLVLAEENARLKEMLGLEAQGAATPKQRDTARISGITVSSSSASKIELFESLFRGRADVFARRWQSRSGGSGYAPACANEWRSGLCDKRRVKCADCANRELLPLSASTIQDHLTGRSTVGIYPMLDDETCHFLAIDFDDETWRDIALPLQREPRLAGRSVFVDERLCQYSDQWAYLSSIERLDRSVVDAALPALARMWEKRLRGYRSMGYRVEANASPNSVKLL
ncbi:MAG: hypothetical protein Q8K99_06340 [Actinomycetota bacterium]|nr:hypothetical protein [Actinomycetota bacterium]